VLHCVGLAIKTSLVPMMIDAVKISLSHAPIDEAISLWAHRRGAAVAYTMPSLVDHNYKLPTVIEHHQTMLYPPTRVPCGFEPRRAWRTGTRESWNDSALVVPAPVFDPGTYVM
jgi:hypothetical protein